MKKRSGLYFSKHGMDGIGGPVDLSEYYLNITTIGISSHPGVSCLGKRTSSETCCGIDAERLEPLGLHVHIPREGGGCVETHVDESMEPDFRLHGVSVWAQWQLEHEIIRGAWKVSYATALDVFHLRRIFDDEEDRRTRLVEEANKEREERRAMQEQHERPRHLVSAVLPSVEDNKDVHHVVSTSTLTRPHNDTEAYDDWLKLSPPTENLWNRLWRRHGDRWMKIPVVTAEMGAEVDGATNH